MSKRRRAVSPVAAALIADQAYRSTPIYTTPVRIRTKVAESVATVTPVRQSVREAGTAVAGSSPGRLRARLIRAGWSLNSVFYPPAVLRRDAAKWGKGCPVFVDHDTDAEEEARPCGSVKNLAGVLESDAVWNEQTQSLEADIRLFAPWREAITDMAEYIGMSIRAWVYAEQGEADGRKGLVVNSIEEARSVDFVTVPAAGGGVLAVLESARQGVAEARNAGHWFEAQIHASFTQLADRQFGEGYLTREERIVLSGAVGDALAAFASRLESDAPHLYERDPWMEPDEPMQATPTEEADGTPEPESSAEEAVDSTPEPAEADVTDGAPPTAPNPPSEEEPEMSGTQTGAPPEQAGTAPVVDTPPAEPTSEAANRAVLEAMQALTRQVTALTEANATLVRRADERDAADRTARNRQTAREAVDAALTADTIPADLRRQIGPRVAAAVLGNIPTAESGDVDTTALGQRISEAVAAESGYAAQLLESAGVGRPTGLGSQAAQPQTVEEFETSLAEAFKKLGLSASEAAVAAKGRK